MMTYYTVIALESILLMMILGIMTNMNDLLSQYKRKMFLLLSLVIIVAIVSEWSGSISALSGGRFRQFHAWTKVMELSLTPVVPFLCAEILEQSARFTKKAKWFCYLLLFHAGLEILSVFTGFIFYIDDNGTFNHGPFYWIYLAHYLGIILYTLWIGYRVSHQYQNKHRFILIAMLALLLFGTAINQIDKSIKSAWFTVSIVVTLIYIFYNDMLQRVDEMTMLFNRTSYDNRLMQLRKPVIIQFFDVDSFKAVNDNYGHLYGDQCLRVFGRMIRSTYKKYGRCYRIGGDEFCVILDSADSPLTDLNAQFFSAVQTHREKDVHFPYISLGHAQYDPSHGTIEEALQTVDAHLYRNKERNKIKFGPVTIPEASKDFAPASLVAEEKQNSVPKGSLDTTGLTDRIFAAFSGTSKRNYLYVCNMTTQVSRWSVSAVKYFDLPGEYMFNAGQIWESYIHPQDRKMYHDDIEAVFSGRRAVHDLEYRVRNRFGEYVACTCRGVVLKGEGTEPDLFAGTIINHGIVDDVDPVTSLHSNVDFTKSIQRLIEDRSEVCIIKLGLEHFRHINAMYGKQGGDQILRLFGIELRELIEGKGRVFRLDGAKFALYLYDADRNRAREVFSRICEIAESKIKINNLRIPLRVYGGAVLLDNKHSYTDYLVRSSLIYAMDQSLENYHSELTFAEDIPQSSNFRNVQLYADIHHDAMDGCKNFFLCYQPIVSFSTGAILGAEVLLRWKKEPYGIVPPDSFIPWLENDPAFIQVGNWILRQAMEETRALRQADPRFLLNINIAMPQLEHRSFREDVLNILADTGCPPQNLCLELTERCRQLDLDFLTEELKFFRSHDISVALDDFGTGFSSLTLLLQLPVSEVKIDRMLLADIFTNEITRYMIEHILGCAKQAGFHTCVEGIETKEQRDLIASMSGDYYQGYYCSKPLPIEEFMNFYRNTTASSE